MQWSVAVVTLSHMQYPSHGLVSRVTLLQKNHCYHCSKGQWPRLSPPLPLGLTNVTPDFDVQQIIFLYRIAGLYLHTTGDVSFGECDKVARCSLPWTSIFTSVQRFLLISGRTIVRPWHTVLIQQQCQRSVLQQVIHVDTVVSGSCRWLYIMYMWILYYSSDISIIL